MKSGSTLSLYVKPIKSGEVSFAGLPQSIGASPKTIGMLLSLSVFMHPHAGLAQISGAIPPAQTPILGPGGSSNATSGIRARLDMDVTAEVLQPLQVNSVSALNFGRFGPSGQSGTISISVDGVRTGQNVIVGDGIGAAANIDLTGPAGANVGFVLPSSLVLSQLNGSNQMIMRPFAASQTFRLGPQGTGQVALGGILDVGPSQATGSYRGEFTVTFSYQ
jgi:hypothetical protein